MPPWGLRHRCFASAGRRPLACHTDAGLCTWCRASLSQHTAGSLKAKVLLRVARFVVRTSVGTSLNSISQNANDLILTCVCTSELCRSSALDRFFGFSLSSGPLAEGYSLIRQAETSRRWGAVRSAGSPWWKNLLPSNRPAEALTRNTKKWTRILLLWTYLSRMSDFGYGQHGRKASQRRRQSGLACLWMCWMSWSSSPNAVAR